MDFNIQQVLADMDRRAEERFRALEAKLDVALVQVQEQGTRIVSLESTQRTLRWVVTAVVTAGLIYATGILTKHTP